MRSGLVVDGTELEQSLLRVRVGDVTGLVFVDTGAAFSFFSRDFLADAGVQTESREVTLYTVQGTRPGSVDVAHNFEIRIAESGPVIVPGAVGIELPQPLVEAGIVGGINPQSLTDAATAVVLDLPSNRLARMPVETARALLAGVRIDDDSTEVCRYEHSGIDAFVYSTEVEVGGERLRFQLDTGSGTSWLAFDHPVGRVLYESAEEEMRSRGLVGEAVERLAVDVPVRVGNRELVLEWLAVSIREAQEQQCPFHGLLGLDVLGSCVLVLESNEISIGCQ